MTVDLSKRLLMLGISSSVILNPVLAFADDDDDDERDNDRSDDNDNDSGSDRSDDRDSDRDDDNDDSSDGNDDRSGDRDSNDDSSDDKDDEDDSEDDDNNKGRNRGSDDEDDEDDSLDDIMSDDSKLRELQNQLNQGDLTPQQRERIQNILNEAREKFGLDDSVERMIREENARELSGEIEKSLIRNGWE